MHTKQSYAEQMMICTSIKKKIADQKRMCTSPGNFFGNLQIRVLEDGRHPMTSTKKKQKKTMLCAGSHGQKNGACEHKNHGTL
jgi:hypothetical protein